MTQEEKLKEIEIERQKLIVIITQSKARLGQLNLQRTNLWMK